MEPVKIHAGPQEYENGKKLRKTFFFKKTRKDQVKWRHPSLVSSVDKALDFYSNGVQLNCGAEKLILNKTENRKT